MLDDLRLALRGLLRARGLAIAAVLCLALGIGGTTIVYSVTSALVLHPVPAARPTGLVMVGEVPPARPTPDDAAMAPANYLDLARRNRSFTELAAFTNFEASVTGIDEPERVSGFRVTPSYFHLLGVQPALGRVFTADDARYAESPSVVIISDGFWHRRFGADSALIGKRIRINDVPRTVVGVMPAGFVFPPGAELWSPLSLDGAYGRDRDGRTLRGVLARLAPGVTVAQANADARGVMRELRREYPGDDANWDMRVEPANAFYGQHARPYMVAELTAVLLVLLIACANVANLLLARATTRTREIAVRIALGASRARILRQTLAESLVLSAAGGLLGMVFAVWGLAAVRTILPPEQALLNPGWTRMELSVGVLAFAAAVSIATAIVVGLVPAVVASGADPHQSLGDGGRNASGGQSSNRLRGLLVAAEVALAVAMLAGTIVTVRGFTARAYEEPGYRVDHALTMQLTAPIARYPRTADAEAMYDRVADAIRTVPGVDRVGYSSWLPPEWTDHDTRIFLEGEARPSRTDAARAPRSQIVSPDYFGAMGIRIVSGRGFTVQDDSVAPSVVVVSETMARAYWPGENPLGRRIGYAGNDSTLSTVIGVAADVRFNPNVGTADAPVYYSPVAQAHPWRTMSFVVRTDGDPAALAPSVDHAIAAAAPTVAPGSVFTLEHLRDGALSPQRLTSEMMSAFAVIALVLAAIGIHGVMSYTVAQRTRDIGIRTALGAQPIQIVRDVVWPVMRFVALGLVVGVAGAVVMTRTLGHLMTAIAARDPLALVAAATSLAVIAVAGGVMPARRATRVDAAVALRADG